MSDGDRWFFDRFARIYEVVMPPADLEPLLAGLDAAGREVEHVLDVGGGTGRAARALDLPDRTVIDASPGMLREVPPGMARVLASAAALPVRDGAADAVLIVDALHHIPDHDATIAECARALAPGGVLVIREFDRDTLRGRALEVAEHAIGMRSTFRSADALADRLSAAGFEASVLDRGFACTVVGRKPGGT